MCKTQPVGNAAAVCGYIEVDRNQYRRAGGCQQGLRSLLNPCHRSHEGISGLFLIHQEASGRRRTDTSTDLDVGVKLSLP